MRPSDDQNAPGTEGAAPQGANAAAGKQAAKAGAGEAAGAPPPGTRVRAKVDSSIPASLSILALLGVLALLHFASSVIVTILSSILIALVLEPFVLFLAGKGRLGRQVASIVVVFLAMALLYGILYIAYDSGRQLFSDLPILIEQVRKAPLVQQIADQVFRLTEMLQEAGRNIAPAAPAVPGKGPAVILREGTSWTDTVLHGLGSLTTVVFSLSFIPFLVYFILADKEKLTRRTRELFPDEHRDAAGAIIEDIERMMRTFIVGNAIVAGILSAATSVVFLLVGLPYWIVLGILSGTVSTIPYLGVVLALLPPLVVGLVSFDSGVPLAIIVASVFGLHVIAANLLIPKLVGKGVQLNAVTSTVAIMFFGWMWGGMGLILGIPIVAVAKCVMDNVTATKRIGRWMGE